MSRFLSICMLLATVFAAAQTQPSQPQQTKPAGKGVIFWNVSRRSAAVLLQNVPQSNALRLAQLRQVFTDLQCRDLHDQPAAGGTNLVCTAPGTDPKAGTILFVAGYEHEGPGQSAVSNWSGALMLPFLYHALAVTPRRHTFLFAELDGESGAEAFFQLLTPEQRRGIQGVVALDALGLGPAQYYISPNDLGANPGWYWLPHQFQQAAIDQKVAAPIAAIPGAWQKIDTTRLFRYHGIPSILIHSVDFSTRQLAGTARDTSEAINQDAYFASIVLLSDYAVELDQPWPSLTDNAASGASRRGRH